MRRPTAGSSVVGEWPRRLVGSRKRRKISIIDMHRYIGAISRPTEIMRNEPKLESVAFLALQGLPSVANPSRSCCNQCMCRSSSNARSHPSRSVLDEAALHSVTARALPITRQRDRHVEHSEFGSKTPILWRVYRQLLQPGSKTSRETANSAGPKNTPTVTTISGRALYPKRPICSPRRPAPVRSRGCALEPSVRALEHTRSLRSGLSRCALAAGSTRARRAPSIASLRHREHARGHVASLNA